MPQFVAHHPRLKISVDPHVGAADLGCAQVVTATGRRIRIDEGGVERQVDSRSRGGRLGVVANLEAVTDRAIERDRVPAIDIPGQPGLLEGVL